VFSIGSACAAVTAHFDSGDREEIRTPRHKHQPHSATLIVPSANGPTYENDDPSRITPADIPYGDAGAQYQFNTYGPLGYDPLKCVVVIANDGTKDDFSNNICDISYEHNAVSYNFGSGDPGMVYVCPAVCYHDNMLPASVTSACADGDFTALMSRTTSHECLEAQNWGCENWIPFDWIVSFAGLNPLHMADCPFPDEPPTNCWLDEAHNFLDTSNPVCIALSPLCGQPTRFCPEGTFDACMNELNSTFYCMNCPGSPWVPACSGATPTPTPTPEPTATPTPEPTASPTPEPTASPTPEPSASPTPEPTASPTPEPTASPAPEPSASPTPEPTATPTPAVSQQCQTCLNAGFSMFFCEAASQCPNTDGIGF